MREYRYKNCIRYVRVVKLNSFFSHLYLLQFLTIAFTNVDICTVIINLHYCYLIPYIA